MSGISANLVRGDSPYEQLISSIIAIESQPKVNLQQEKSDHQRMKGVLSDFSKMLTDLQSAVGKLTDPVTSFVGGRKASTSSTAFGVTATDRASTGTHQIEILRLASADSRVSRQFDRAGSALASFVGTQSFQIDVFSPTSDEPDRRVSIEVSVDLEDGNDAAKLDQIQTAIRGAMEAAVDDGTIKRAEAASVSIVNETSGTARLSLRSASTGYDGRLGFTDSSGLLAALEVNADAVMDGTGGGQVVAVGSSETESALNAQFVLNGLTLYRSSNNVSDALTGVTLNLNQVSTEGRETFTVGVDHESIEESVNGFIKKYNELISYIERRSRVDGDTGTRGDFAGDSAIRGLRASLRNSMIQGVGGSDMDLAALGIEIERDGTLTLKDAAKLGEAVEQSPDLARGFFGGENGIGKRVEDLVSGFVGSGGVITERQKSYDARIKRIDGRIKTLEETLTRREDSLRMQFAKLQETISVLQGQFDTFQSYLGGAYF